MKKEKLTVYGIIVVIAIAIVSFSVFRNTDNDNPTVAIFNLLSHPILDNSIKGIEEGLSESGYSKENLNLIKINANGEMDKLNAFAKELLSSKPDVIIPVSTPVTQAVFKESQKSQKIIFSTVTNPSDVGMDNKPSNMTGVCDRVNYKANFDLILQLFPKTKTVGIIYNAGERNSEYGVEQIKPLAKEKNISLKLVSISQPDEVEDAAKGLVDSVDVFYVGSDNTVVGALPALLNVAYSKNIPVIASDSGSVEQGALAAVSVNYIELGKKVGQIVAQVLKDKSMPADLDPVMFMGNSLNINLKSANKIDYSFSENILKDAEVIIQ